MIINLISKPFNYVVIDEYYDENELGLVMQEIQALEPHSLSAEFTKSSKNGTGKSGKGLFLEIFYENNRSASKILNANRKIFAEELCSVLENFDSSFRHLKNSNFDSTLVNFYKNKQEYPAHKDCSTISTVTFLKVGNFTGGDFCFTEYKERVPFKHNRIVIFNGCVEHQAEPIYTNDSSYRSTIAQFIGYK